jgi:mono/diheme cytochrome c family protein
MINRMHCLIGLAVGGMALAGTSWLAAPAQAQNGGEKTYKAKCMGCHGPDATASTPAGKAMKVTNACSEEAKKVTDAQWTEIIVKGKNKMPSFDKKLTEAEIKDVIAYMRGLCKK